MMTCPILYKQWSRWREELKNGRKDQWENKPRNPLHNLWENLLNTWHVLTFFIDLILGTKKIRDRWTSTGLGNSYWGPADTGAFGTHWGITPARVPQIHPWLLACLWGFKETRNERLFFTVLVSSTLGFLSLPLCWVLLAFSFHHGSVHQVWLLMCLASSLQGPTMRVFQPS